MHSQRAFKMDSSHSHKFLAACGPLQEGRFGPSRTWVDDNFYVIITDWPPALMQTWNVWLGFNCCMHKSTFVFVVRSWCIRPSFQAAVVLTPELFGPTLNGPWFVPSDRPVCFGWCESSFELVPPKQANSAPLENWGLGSLPDTPWRGSFVVWKQSGPSYEPKVISGTKYSA